MPSFDYDHVIQTATFIRSRVAAAPQVAVVLGTGLGAFGSRLADVVILPYDRLPGWPVSSLMGHDGRLIIGTLEGRTVAALAGRVHLYQGFDAPAVAFSVRVMGALGVSTVIVTNAAGGINARLFQGALMLIEDHINLTGANPLVGAHDKRLGPRFPDMTELYSSRLRGLAGEAARARGVEVERGVYAALLGPSYETPAEIRFLRTIGADAVGMSTALEAIAARHMGLEVLGISCITNMAAGIEGRPLDHDDVLSTARRVTQPFDALLEGTIERL